MTAQPSLYRRHRFPAEIISHAVRRYYLFSLSLCDIELMLVERGVVVNHEGIRHWWRTRMLPMPCGASSGECVNLSPPTGGFRRAAKDKTITGRLWACVRDDKPFEIWPNLRQDGTLD
jgi:hypothetical protein